MGEGSVQFSSVTQFCPTLRDPMNHSTPGLPVHHQLLESTQTHVHCVGDAIQPSHPLSSPSPPALNLSQHQGLLTSIQTLQSLSTVLLEVHKSQVNVFWSRDSLECVSIYCSSTLFRAVEIKQ